MLNTVVRDTRVLQQHAPAAAEPPDPDPKTAAVHELRDPDGEDARAGGAGVVTALKGSSCRGAGVAS